MSASALLVIDMQNGFCHPEGSLPRLGLGLEGAAEAVEAAAVAVDAARRAAVPVVFTRHVYRPGRADEGRNLATLSPDVGRVGGLAAGSWDGAIVDALGWRADDLTVDKVRFDAFLWTSLEPLLAGLGVDHLWVAGVVTNICVESTVRSAFMRDRTVSLLGSGCAARTARLHAIGVEAMIECGFATLAAPGDVARPSPAAVAA